MQDETLWRLEREGLKIASFSRRIFAYLIDNVLLSVVVMIILSSSILNAKDENEILYIVQDFFYGLVFIQFAYHSIFGYLYGASVGKILCKIAIVDEALLDKPNLLQAMVRAAMRQVSDMAFMLGFAWAFGNELHKTWHDYAAKTLVIEIA